MTEGVDSLFPPVNLDFNSLSREEQNDIETMLTPYKSRKADFDAPRLSEKLLTLYLDELAKNRKQNNVPLVAYHPLSKTANSWSDSFITATGEHTERDIKMMAACTARLELEMYSFGYRQVFYPEIFRK